MRGRLCEPISWRGLGLDVCAAQDSRNSKSLSGSSHSSYDAGWREIFFVTQRRAHVRRNVAEADVFSLELEKVSPSNKSLSVCERGSYLGNRGSFGIRGIFSQASVHNSARNLRQLSAFRGARIGGRIIRATQIIIFPPIRHRRVGLQGACIRVLTQMLDNIKYSMTPMGRRQEGELKNVAARSVVTGSEARAVTSLT